MAMDWTVGIVVVIAVVMAAAISEDAREAWGQAGPVVMGVPLAFVVLYVLVRLLSFGR
jgi:hypothetical protein